MLAKSITNYIKFHDLYVDTYTHGPFQNQKAQASGPVPQASLWKDAKASEQTSNNEEELS